MLTAAQILDRSVGAFVDALVDAGVRDVSACPGSRSTPLAIKLAQHPAVRLWMHLDERSAAYFGLGLARARRSPVALLATSGTATANFFAAIVEAFFGRVPLVVLTADRPHELRDRGAAQTIDQVRLYGEHVKWFFDLPEPDTSHADGMLVASFAARAVAEASADPPGPVHLNWPFRDPLVPEATPASSARASVPRVSTGRRAPSARDAQQLAEALRTEPQGLIVCGPQDDPDVPDAVTDLARRLQYPILADSLSGVRYGRHDRSQVLDAYDASLRLPRPADGRLPRVVLQIGAVPTSKPLLQFLERSKVERYVLVDGGAGWRDPSGLATDVVHADPVLLCEALARDVPHRSSPSDWLIQWTGVDRAARRAIDEHLHGLTEPFEGSVFPALAPYLPDGATLIAGNSMPVRDLDTFLAGSERRWRVLSNRGVNGIDGVVSTAFGLSAAGQGPVVLVIGDLSFYHDMNGLLAARRHGLDLLVVLINNDGGGIFSFLPQAEHEGLDASFETLFGTPHGLDFRPFVEGYGGRFERIRQWTDFSPAVAEGLARGGLHVVEVPTERTRNVQQHRAVWRAVSEALSPSPVR